MVYIENAWPVCHLNGYSNQCPEDGKCDSNCTSFAPHRLYSEYSDEELKRVSDNTSRCLKEIREQVK